MKSHNVTMLGTGLIGDFWQHDRREVDRVFAAGRGSGSREGENPRR
jgi:hypothetical protein